MKMLVHVSRSPVDATIASRVWTSSKAHAFPNSPPEAATNERAILGLTELQMPAQDWDVPFESGLALTRWSTQ